MTKIAKLSLAALVFIVGTQVTQAQAWTKKSKVISIGIGASQFLHNDAYYYGNPHKSRYWYGLPTAQLNVQGEFGVHKYVGVGFTTGIGGRRKLPNGYVREMNVPIGLIANFHFYQLIADKTGKGLHSDKLDIYMGASLGSGMAATTYEDNVQIVPLAFGGLHFGLRYYFVPKVGLNAEMGWGKSIVNLGISFKI